MFRIPWTSVWPSPAQICAAHWNTPFTSRPPRKRKENLVPFTRFNKHYNSDDAYKQWLHTSLHDTCGRNACVNFYAVWSSLMESDQLVGVLMAFCQVLSYCNPDETLIDSASLTNLQVSEEPPIALEAWERTEFSKKETLEIQSPIWRA